jgi:hypothetical protein
MNQLLEQTIISSWQEQCLEVDEAVDIIKSLYGDIVFLDIKVFDKETTRTNHIQPNVIKLTDINSKTSKVSESGQAVISFGSYSITILYF